MRRLDRIAEPRSRTGLDSVESKTPLLIGGRAAESVKVRIDQLLLQVVGMIVAPVGVRLPDFHQCIINRRAIAVQHASHDYDSLASGLAPGKRFICRPHQRRLEERTDCLRWRLRQDHFRLCVGVALRPRNTKSNRYPSARSGIVTSISNDATRRCRAAGSGTLLKIGSSASSGSPGKYI